MSSTTSPPSARNDATSATDLHDPAVRQQVEEALRDIPGVLAARLVPGFDRQVDELHVVTSLDKQPKATVRDSVSLLMARFDVTADHRVISVVRLDEDDSGFAEHRVRIGSVTTTAEALSCGVRVMLLDGDQLHEGEDSGPNSPAGRQRAAARATLRALDHLLGDGAVSEVEGVEVMDVRGHTVALTFVHLANASGDTTLVGSAMVRNDDLDAVARSVLDAANRMLTR